METNKGTTLEIKTEIANHRGEKRIKLMFTYDVGLIQKVKAIPGARWSKTMGCWHVPFSNEIINFLISQNISIKPEIQLSGNLTTKNDVEGRNSQQVKVSIYKNVKAGILYIDMPYNEKWKREIKQLDGNWWHPEARMWSVFYSPENINFLKGYFKDENCLVNIIDKNFSDSSQRKFKEKAPYGNIPAKYMEQLKLENKSPRTIEVYSGFIAQFLLFFQGRDIEAISIESIREYILNDREKHGYSESYQNQNVNALKSFYKIMFKRSFDSEELPRPKQGRYLPKVIEAEQVQKMFTMCRNKKHKMILILLYGFGLRIGEVKSLLCDQVELKNRRIVIKGKGNKERALPIPDFLVKEIKSYMDAYIPVFYFIEGQDKNQYASTSIQKMIKKLAIKAGIKRDITPHMLRHCYATHLLDKGIDLRYIQTLLGHSSSKTTEIYTHVTVKKLKSLANTMDGFEI